MIKFTLKISLAIFLFLIVVSQQAQAFWKFPFEIKIGNPEYTKQNNEYSENRQIAINVVDKLVSAYESRRSARFGTLVSDDFTLDKSSLDDSVRQDFLKYSYININFFVNTVIKSSDGKMAVSVNYTRTLEDRIAGKTISNSGNTELILKKENGIYKLYSMRKPYLFGVTGI